MTWSVHTLRKVYKLVVFTTTPQLQSLRCSSVYICFTVLLLLFFSSSYFFSACCGSFVPVQSGPDIFSLTLIHSLLSSAPSSFFPLFYLSQHWTEDEQVFVSLYVSNSLCSNAHKHGTSLLSYFTTTTFQIQVFPYWRQT